MFWSSLIKFYIQKVHAIMLYHKTSVLIWTFFAFEYVRTVLIKLTIMEICVQTDRVKKATL